MSKQVITILGSTGTIGVNTLDVIARHPDKFEVFCLVGHKNIQLLLEQALRFQPEHLVICDSESLDQWIALGFSNQYRNQTGKTLEVTGQESLTTVCQHEKVDTVVAAIVGAAGLFPTLRSLEAGKRVLLANKESLVLAGRFMMEACLKAKATLLPIDSEHNAIYQCLPADYDIKQPASHGVDRLILTASGGPFRTLPLSCFEQITPAQAVAHPNWVMGRKISVDSATMANKSLELIEALWLFGLPATSLSVLIHPQSIVHSMVEYRDGSVLAQLGCPDMRTPIAHVLGLPNRIESGSARLNLAEIGNLSFEEPDLNRFPMLTLARQALHKPDVLAPVFNAANEIAVDEFLNERIGYKDIYAMVSECMASFADRAVDSLDSAFDLDQEVRAHARQSVPEFSR
ncbi:1-deoxy-D-xylulose-5-phosphate reductoisomerase [Limnobacter sp.]|uniref:1-deoxy-D-xylulose-5-phosphate reductoisomerase n=1 Tax=Limnobacter sp. TaxID=2003368 RepID=UPI0025911441|nr:1-deoxy-D-xylulose-5-phosphate reductoisomerase [Limnobacter sp.]